MPRRGAYKNIYQNAPHGTNQCGKDDSVVVKKGTLFASLSVFVQMTFDSVQFVIILKVCCKIRLNPHDTCVSPDSSGA